MRQLFRARWREQTALARNFARGFVVSDTTLLELARSQSGRMEELTRIERFTGWRQSVTTDELRGLIG